MFKNLIYYNSIKIIEFKALLQGKKSVHVDKVKMNKGKSIGGDLKIISGSYKEIDEIEGGILPNILLDCNEFESLLQEHGGNYYYDFLGDEGISLEDVTRNAIIRFEGKFKIPEEFDMMDLLSKFKPYLISSMNTDKPEEAIMKELFSKNSTKIPSFIESEVFLEDVGFSKLNSNHLCYEIEDIEDYESQDVVIIAQILSTKKINKDTIMFDVMKDLFSFNRSIRRQVGNSEIDGLENIKSEKDAYKLEVLAIYQ
ncbi:MAG: hypothetical protein NUK57_08180 [Gudongella sp.]|nr:hypothetical protein [Gudongella sp.]